MMHHWRNEKTNRTSFGNVGLTRKSKRVQYDNSILSTSKGPSRQISGMQITLGRTKQRTFSVGTNKVFEEYLTRWEKRGNKNVLCHERFEKSPKGSSLSKISQHRVNEQFFTIIGKKLKQKFDNVNTQCVIRLYLLCFSFTLHLGNWFSMWSEKSVRAKLSWSWC